ncbi:hypothetical protein O0I10_006649 [Lichtheimia ornata]|uniref:F-box domain-containing protein n=1 Tax=Lichtheimia ornata TaxID=688661 RepID=A0AAD7V3M1_9FUNG|nr:uncharacterized protein O0I10_006649 [Lichtheimia ornata]KAJ8657585.1 hypothetical protein O0I10_006649 [Lichtheimia ornata]
MTHSIWTDLCKQPILKATSEKYTTIVYDSTTRLHQLIDSILSALNERVIGFTKLANFDAALGDVSIIQQLSPSSALGYLCAASVYKEQGKQLQVIDICNKGLDVVDPNDTDYSTLQQMKADAMQYQNKRIDFITDLPWDLVTTTLLPTFVDDDSPLDASRACPYLYVCKQWRDLILQHSNGLRFEIGPNEEQADPRQQWQLVTFARHIKALHLRRYTKGTWLYDLLRDHDFCSLRELYFDAFSNNGDDFVSFLQSLGGPLTHLAINDTHSLHFEGMFPLAEVLSACPNLLSFAVTHPFLCDFTALSMTTYSNMTTLSLFSTTDPFSRDEIIRICQCFPALKELHLSRCEDSMELVLMVPRYCPLLKSVEIDINYYAVNLNYFDHNIGHQELEMTKFSIFRDGSEGNDLFFDIEALLRQHRTTLEDVEWTVSPERDYRDLYDIQYPRLKKLSLYSGGWWILRNAPMLETLALASESINNNPEVLDTIPPNLKALELRLHRGRFPTNNDVIERYLHRVSQQCRLQQLAIDFDAMDTFCYLRDTLTRFNTLERLAVGFPGNWDNNKMESFLGALVIACPYLSSLGIDCINAPSADTMNTLKQLRHLKQLTFSVKDTDGAHSFWHAIRSFSQLKRIRIYPSNEVNHAKIERLKEQRPDMKIIVEDTFKCF